MKILQSATINNARVFGLDEVVGSIEEGKKADLLLLDSNPLKMASAYNDILLVIKDGKVHSREDLSASRR